MAEVDPEDDTIQRWIVYWYRFDPARHERRHCVVAAYETEREMISRMDVEAANLEAKRAAGLADQSEHLSGSEKGRGYKQRADEQRLTEKLGLPRPQLWLNYAPDGRRVHVDTSRRLWRRLRWPALGTARSRRH
jgi:hypothetical protein